MAKKKTKSSSFLEMDGKPSKLFKDHPNLLWLIPAFVLAYILSTMLK